MFISVIITVYNKEKHIRNCIESIVNQSYKELEIIIINDGSTDNSDRIINECLQDCRRDYKINYHSQNNQGVSKARNTGLNLATGEYIFFVDGDDELPKHSISTLAAQIKENDDIVVGNFLYKSKHSIIRNNRIMDIRYSGYAELKSTQVKYDMFMSNGRPLASACNKLYRKEFLTDNKIYFEDNVLAEDRLFNLYCYSYYPDMVIVNNYTYIINRVKNSRSRSYNENFYQLTINLLIKFYRLLETNNQVEENMDLLFINLVSDIEKLHRYVYKYSAIKYKDLKTITLSIKRNDFFNCILKDGLKNRYFSRVKLNNKKWFLIIYVRLINYFPQLILPYIGLSDLGLKLKTRIRSKKEQSREIINNIV